MTAGDSIKRKMNFEVNAVNPASSIGRYFESKREAERLPRLFNVFRA